MMRDVVAPEYMGREVRGDQDKGESERERERAHGMRGKPLDKT